MVIVIAGFPGSGKSYFAQKLAARLGASSVNSDQVRHAMRASGKYSFEDKLIVYKEMLKQTVALINAGKDVVIDGTFYHHTMREMFLELETLHAIPVYFIEIVADEALIQKRLVLPRKFSEADYKVYETVRDEFEEITMPHLILESKEDNIEDMLQTATQYIKDGRK